VARDLRPVSRSRGDLTAKHAVVATSFEADQIPQCFEAREMIGITASAR
jgi:hypothetical protein